MNYYGGEKYTFMALSVYVMVTSLKDIISIGRITIMITLEDWVMIKHLHKEGVPKFRIAEELGLDRKTVDKAILVPPSNGRAKNEDKPPHHTHNLLSGVLVRQWSEA